MLAPKATTDNKLTKNRLLRKLDITLLPIATLLLLILNFDRAAVGIERDLGLKGLDFNIGVSVYYITYFAFQIPSNMALRVVGSVWLALLVISFGIVSISTAFITNYAGFLATRIMLGVTESGLVSGTIYTLSLYYPRSELVMRICTFLPLGSALSGAVGGFLASGLLSIDSIGSVASWRKIFLVQGIITTGIGILCVFFIPDPPKNSRLLAEDERALVLEWTAKNSNSTDASTERRFRPRLVLRSFTFHVGVCALSHLFVNISLQGLGVFLPAIIASPTSESQLRTVPPHLVEAFCAFCNGYMSYRFRQRGVFIAIGSIVTIIGYAIFVGSDNSHTRYGACFLALAGSRSSSPILLSWAAENVASEAVRASSIAIVDSAGALGSFIGVWAYLPKDGPNYRHAHSLNIAGACITFILAIIGTVYLNLQNAKRDRGEHDHRSSEKSRPRSMSLAHSILNFGAWLLADVAFRVYCWNWNNI
ncbi:MFS general substrate transporter [Hysterangium stoloniferum]|nr:MFS general substrate transporter [Hysterangium stoloniferum]